MASERQKIADSIIDKTISGDFEDDITEIIRYYAFWGCSSLNSVSLYKAETINQFAFGECTNIKKICLPSASYISMAFYSCGNMTELIVGTDSDNVCTYSTPGSYYDPKNSNLKIYVPDDLVSSYKTETNWSRLASKIYGISERPE